MAKPNFKFEKRQKELAKKKKKEEKRKRKLAKKLEAEHSSEIEAADDECEDDPAS